MELTDIHKRMLQAETFHIDGWTSANGRKAASDLERAGLVTSFVGGGDQYTAFNFTITDKGREALSRN